MVASGTTISATHTDKVFRKAFKRRHCLVPVDNFYEWKRIGPKEKQPYANGLQGCGLMALAELWENWKSSADEMGAELHHSDDNPERFMRRSFITGCR